jgi:hypothetical protein
VLPIKLSRVGGWGRVGVGPGSSDNNAKLRQPAKLELGLGLSLAKHSILFFSKKLLLFKAFCSLFPKKFKRNCPPPRNFHNFFSSSLFPKTSRGFFSQTFSFLYHSKKKKN